jgi:putative ABC transport system permease protein
MEYKELVKSAIIALRANILRTSLTMLGIVIGISSVILIVSIGQGAVAFVTNELSSFGTNVFQISSGTGAFSSIAGADSITFDDVEAIKTDQTLTNIDVVAPVAISTVNVSANDVSENLITQGATAGNADILKPDIIQGEFLSEENVLENDRVVVIGIDAMENFFGANASVVGETIRVDNKPFRIIGVLRSDNALAGGVLNNAIIVPIGVVMDQLPGGDKIQEVNVSVHDPDQINQTIEDVEALLRDRHNIEIGGEDDFQVRSFQDILSTVQTITNLLTVMVAGISAISLIVGGVGVMNIMLVSVTERTKEIGLLKSIGAKEKDILTQFLIESMVMSGVGGIIGIVIGICGAFLISLVVGIPFSLSIPAIFAAVLVSTMVGLVFGLYPARRAAKLNPIDALIYE